jgi:hypothetical protein
VNLMPEARSDPMKKPRPHVHQTKSLKERLASFRKRRARESGANVQRARARRPVGQGRRLDTNFDGTVLRVRR